MALTSRLLWSLALGVGITACGPPAASAPRCAAPTGSGTVHQREIVADEVWSAADSPHQVTSSLRVFSTVTIEACSTVLLGEGVRVTIGSEAQAGVIRANGEAERPVVIDAIDASKPWGALVVASKGLLDLTSTRISNGANPSAAQNGGGSILAYGLAATAPTVTRNVRVSKVTISSSRGYGVNFQRQSGFTSDSSELFVLDGGTALAPYPIFVEPGAAGTLPTGSVFQGNATNEIFINPVSASSSSDTFRNVGVPYRIGGRLLVAPPQDGPPSTLTIEAGVTLRFENTSDNGLTLGTSPTRQGLLVANGTAAAPITFTSAKATPAAGDWKHIYFRNTPATGNSLTYGIVEFAGAPSGLQGYGCGPVENDASVLIVPDSGRPNEAFVRNTIIRNAAGDTGLLLGWLSDQAGPDFVSTNTFTNVPSCRVSRWRNQTGAACPGSVNGSPLCL